MCAKYQQKQREIESRVLRVVCEQLKKKILRDASFVSDLGAPYPELPALGALVFWPQLCVLLNW